MDWRSRVSRAALVFACTLLLLPPVASAQKKPAARPKPAQRSARVTPKAAPRSEKAPRSVKGKVRRAPAAAQAKEGKRVRNAERKPGRAPAAQTKRENHVASIRERLRAEAGVRRAPAKDADLPMVELTILPGDDHARLSQDLTGSFQSEAVLRTIEPELKPGEKLFIPRAILSPSLSDPAHEEVTFGDRFPSLYSLARELTTADKAELPRVVRNLQRLNGIVDPSKMCRGQTVLVPKSLLAVARWVKPEESVVAAAAPERTVLRTNLAVSRAYLATDFTGLERKSSRFPARLRQVVGDDGAKLTAADRGSIDLVVLHTTEHSASTFENTAAYIQRKRLANYVIGPDGTVYEIIPEEYRAYGCGDSLWEGRYTVDLEAINIEIFANTAPGPYKGEINDAQYEGLRALLEDIQSRRPAIHEGRIVTHRMIALSYKTGTRSRKGDPYVFDWAKVDLPDNSQVIDQDVLLGRAKLCTDERYSDRVTAGQTAAARMARSAL